MLYIKKIRVSKEVIDEINRVKREQKSLFDKRDPQSARIAFNCLDKTVIRDSLIREQHGLCAYCMRRIENNSDMTIEHWQSIEQNVDGAMDYENMLGVCDGGRKVNEADYEEHHVLCCDASKGSKTITISPLNQFHMQKIRYSEDGRIYTYPRDEILEADINEVLHLNGANNLDTCTRLLRGRREAYRAYARFIEKLSCDKKLSRSYIEKRVAQLENQATYDEFAGVIIYFLKRKLKRIYEDMRF